MSLLLALAPSERPQYDALLSGYQDMFLPSTPHEEDRIRELAWLEVRLQQVRVMETAFIEFRIKSQLDSENLTAPRDAAHANSLWASIITGPDFPRLKSIWQRQDRLSRQIDRLRKQLQESRSSRESAEARHPGRPRTQSAAHPEPAIPVPPAPLAEAVPAKPAEAVALIPRSAACPCGSGEKYKRCCGRTAPPLLHYRGPNKNAA